MTLKNRQRLGSAVEKDLYKKIKRLSKNTKIPMSRLLDEAIVDLLKKYSN